jgi:hypothetical protein
MVAWVLGCAEAHPGPATGGDSKLWQLMPQQQQGQQRLEGGQWHESALLQSPVSAWAGGEAAAAWSAGLHCASRAAQESVGIAAGTSSMGTAELGAAGEGELLDVRVEKQCGRHASAPPYQLREGVSSEVMYRLSTHFCLPSTSNGERRKCGARADSVQGPNLFCLQHLAAMRVEKRCRRHALAPPYQLREGVSSEVMYRLSTLFYLPSTSNGERRKCGARADSVQGPNLLAGTVVGAAFPDAWTRRCS